MKKATKLTAGIALALGVSSVAHAAIFDISSVLSGVDGGFGYSGFHYAGNLGTAAVDSDGNPMTGSALVDIPAATGALGSYNDVTGDFNVTLGTDFAAIPSFSLSGIMTFDNAGNLDPSSTLSITFNTLLGGLTTNMIFDAGQQCCSGTNAPNSYRNGLISLWGVNSTPELAYLFPDYNDQVLGLDLRLELTPSAVPVPAAVWLFGSGLVALAGLARRRKT